MLLNFPLLTQFKTLLSKKEITRRLKPGVPYSRLQPESKSATTENET